MTFKEEISIWFFIGICLVVNGALITWAGMYEWLIQPPAHQVVLYNLHANVWWGAILLILGIVYTWHFRPTPHSEAADVHASKEREEPHAK